MDQPDQSLVEKAVQGNEDQLPADVIVESQHILMLDGSQIPYTVTCGTIVLKEEEHKEFHQPHKEHHYI